MPLGLDALSEGAFNSLDAEGQTGIASFYFSDKKYWTTPSDALPKQQFLPRVNNPGFLERTIPILPTASRRVALSVGELTIDNSDGYLDSMVDQYAIDGRRVVIRVGNRRTAYGNFLTLFDGTATGWAAFEDSVKISLRDEMYLLDVPLMTSVYSGAGGLNGGTDLAGKPLPVCFGKCLNVPLVLVDPTNLIYQFNWRAANAVDAVYDAGLALTPAGDVADIQLASVSSGQYKTQLSGGYIKLGSTPAGLVTADVQGDAGDSGYVNKTADIVYRIMNTNAGISAGRLESGSFTTLNALQPAEVGFYFGPTPVLASDAVEAFLAGIGGYVAPTRTGNIRVGRFDAPTGTATVRVDRRHIMDISKLQLPPEVEPAVYSFSVNYQPLFSGPQVTDIAGAVTADRRAFLAQAARTSTLTVPSVQVKNLLARGFVGIPGLYANQSDADLEADRLIDIWGVNRRMYAVTLKSIGYLLDLHDPLQVDFPRWGMGGGVQTRIVGIKEDYSRNETVLTVFR